MSRGREANTLYLTTPNLDQENCEHLAHQHPDRLPTLITALGRSGIKPAAIDSRAKPQHPGESPTRTRDQRQVASVTADQSARVLRSRVAASDLRSGPLRGWADNGVPPGEPRGLLHDM